MRVSRRMRRMARGKGSTSLSLTSLMDVFTNLVFFLLISQGATDIDEPPKDVRLPDSYVEVKPRPTVNILVSDQVILIQGEPTSSMAEVLGNDREVIEPLREKLALIKANTIGLNEQTKDRSNEVTILAHSAVPFKVLKKVMSTCTSAGYTKISLAVNQKTDVVAPPR